MLDHMKPILFNTEMARAILEGRKTVTRRVVKPQPPSSTHPNLFVSPPYRPGDILYVRETWTVWDGDYEYKADVDDGYGPFCSNCTLDICAGSCNSVLKWSPSIHMPREAARIFLRVTDVRVERLQEILTDDCLAPSNIQAEGLTKPCILCIHPDFDCREYIKSGNCDLTREFVKLWDSTIKPADRDLYGWEANPWVWVIAFERISKEKAYEKLFD